MEDNNTSLLSSQESTEETTEQTTQETTQETSQQPKNDGPAIERPEWLLDKYATEDRTIEEAMAEQAKAYNELQSKFGSFTGAPEEYELALPEDVEGDIDSELPQYNEFIQIAKEANMNQETAQKLFDVFVSYQEDMAKQFETDFNEQRKLLGENADSRIENVVRWLGSNLSQEDLAVAETMTFRADQIEVLEKIIGKTRNSPLPKEETTKAPVSDYSWEQFHKDVGSDEYKNNPQFRKRVRQKAATLSPES